MILDNRRGKPYVAHIGMYGTSIKRAISQRGVSIAEAARAMGYKRPDMLYRVLRGESDPSLEALQKLADHMDVPVGDLLPNSGGGVVSEEFRDVLAAISGVAGSDREAILAALVVNARVLSNAYRRTATATTEAAGRILRQLSGMPPELHERAAQIFELGVEKFAQSHLNGEVSSARA